MDAQPLDVDTPQGTARVRLHAPAGARGPRAALVLGHGAGGGVDAPDLRAVAGVAVGAGLAVGLVEQPYRVAGRRSPPPIARCDEAWTAVVGRLAAHELEGLPLVVGGRSMGARIACRTAGATGAAAVLCLAFPVAPPRRRKDGSAPPDRLAELDAVDAPVLVIQGESDPFGIPPSAPGRSVATVLGDHALRADLDVVRAAVGAWLERVLPRR